ncbi:MAG: sulfite exporter TauE/SafE family protein [Deltaproteobacteria bacterium]|nr:sulfite exporter TauE/SafE family protein [Deltaproteobacteria bacterium]
MYIWLLALGLVSGILSGLLGIAGGAVVIPGLVLGLGWGQREAQGTALAMLLPPASILAVFAYHEQGNVRWPPALWMAAGLFVGGLAGGFLAGRVRGVYLRRFFAALLVGIGTKMLFGL